MNNSSPLSLRQTRDKSQHLMFDVCCLANTKLFIGELACVLYKLRVPISRNNLTVKQRC
jgi:hypothetical protein